MSRLLGEYDSHLALIEDRLGIGAHAHGNVIILTGSEAGCEIARDVLETLYKRISKGEHIGAGDFDGLIRHARQESPARPTGRRKLQHGAASSKRARQRKAPTSAR